MKSNYGDDSQQDGNDEDDQLGEFESCLGLSWRSGMQCRHFFKQLHDQDEEIEIEGYHGADDVDPAPRLGESSRIPGEDRYRQHGHCNDSENDRRCDAIYTIIHTLISVVAIFTGFVVLFAMLSGHPAKGWTKWFLIAAV